MNTFKLFKGLQICTLLLSVTCFMSASSQAQIFLDFNADTYNGGYHVTCNGSSNASISVVVEGGELPYSYIWTNGSTTKYASAIGAGVYTVTVTDSESSTATASFTVLEPNVLGVDLSSSEYSGGVNVSYYQGSDGSISTEISGGTPPYSYLWNNGEESSDIEGLSAGTYTVTVTDMNACSAISNITLTEPGQLQITSLTSPTLSSGHNVSCQTMTEWDGSIDVTITGGSPPYTYDWSDGAMTEDRTSMKHGTYTVRITDANDVEIEGAITLTSPNAIGITLSSPTFGNSYNVSCYDCYNGVINTAVTGGISPYSFAWSDSGTDEDRINMNGGAYELVLTDDNGCESISEISLTSPDRDDWTMNGNSGTNPANEFIGTSDSIDLVVRTNNAEVMRIAADGNIAFSRLSGNGNQWMKVDNDGTLFSSTPSLPWETRGNANINDNLDWFGTTTNADIVVKTGDIATSNNFERMRIRSDGKIGIGTSAIPSDVLLAVNGKMICEGVRAKLFVNWPDYVFAKDYELRSLSDLKKFIKKHGRLPYVRSASEIDENGVDLGETITAQMKLIEEMYLHIIQLKQEVEELQRQSH